MNVHIKKRVIFYMILKILLSVYAPARIFYTEKLHFTGSPPFYIKHCFKNFDTTLL